jgi:deoxycytidine triphosphate deaminase
MILNPQQVIELGIVSNIENTTKIQPNAIDFTLDRIFGVNDDFFCMTNNKSKLSHIARTELVPSNISVDCNVTRTFDTNMWTLYAGGAYDCMSNLYVELPDGVAAFLYGRSTCNRNNIILRSGLYDSGFKGNVGFMLEVRQTTAIEVGTFIGQIMFVQADSAHLYAGGYNHESGTMWHTKHVI